MTRHFRRLYDWVLHWADSRHAVVALVLLAVAESSFFPIPPDVLLLAMCLAAPAISFRYAALCTAGSVIGGILGYLIGFHFWGWAAEFFFRWIPGFTPPVFAHMQDLFQQYDFWFVFLAGFTPIPYKIITIGAGVFQINFVIFIVASLVSRGLRFVLIAAMVYRYGDVARGYIDRNFNMLTSVFALLLVGGFIAVRYLT